MPEDYPGSEQHFEPRPAQSAHMTKEERVEAIRASAVSFANDYGPLPAANQGCETARHKVAASLVKILRENGLTIIQR